MPCIQQWLVFVRVAFACAALLLRVKLLEKQEQCLPPAPPTKQENCDTAVGSIKHNEKEARKEGSKHASPSSVFFLLMLCFVG